MFYSPLEQFEPVPFITIFFNEINFSITNVTIIYIYLVLVFSYFLNGYFFYFKDNKTINLNHLSSGSISVDGSASYNYLEKIYSSTFSNNSSYLDLHKNNVISYMSYLANFFISTSSLKLEKSSWISISSLDTSKKEYSQNFYQGFYSILKKEKGFYFNVVFIKRFLNSFYNSILVNTKNINKFKTNSKLHNVLYNFSSGKSFSLKFIPNINFFIFENIYNLILETFVKENIGGSNREATKYFPMVFTLFLFVLLSNYIGLVPYSSTITAYIIVTFSLALMVIVAVNILAARTHGIKFFGNFLPAGCPFALYAIIIPIEFISYVFRVVSLSVRLFANMMAGHTLLAVLAGFGWTMANGGIALFLLHPAPVFVVYILCFLETLVALIQACVFTILTCMYIDEAKNMH